MKQGIAAVVFGFAVLFAGTGFAAQHGMPKGDANAAAPAQAQKDDAAKPAKKATRKRCPKGQVYNKKEKKCMAKAAKGATPATPAAPATPATPAN